MWLEEFWPMNASCDFGDASYPAVPFTLLRSAGDLTNSSLNFRLRMLGTAGNHPMTRFEYAAIFYGFVVGLALAEHLVQCAQAARSRADACAGTGWRRRPRFTPPSSPSAVSGPGGSTRDENHGQRTFLTFLLTAAALSLLFLACAATLPDDVPEQGLDLRKYYFENQRRFWSLYAATFALNSLTWAVALVQSGFGSRSSCAPTCRFLIGNLVGVAIGLASMYVRKPWWHAFAIVASLAFVLLVFAPMQLT